jgi:hypothetical protein
MRFHCAIRCGILSVGVLSLFAIGCGKKEAPVDSPARPNLEKIGDAYVRATIQFNHPPNSLEELLPALKSHGNPDEILISPVDGQKFEIVWGVELRMLKAQGNEIPIVAYERTGKDGKRHVLRGRADVLLMDEKTLKGAKFPAGYTFPF